MLSHFYDEALTAAIAGLSSTSAADAFVFFTSRSFGRNCFNSYSDNVHQPMLRSCQVFQVCCSVMLYLISICEFVIPRVLRSLC